ncbi:MAG: tetratricopeptide repeat protein [Acidobacteria bacterium]|nr:tetratricopeptide repeat protein [Acidobacteriota bacterium]MBI3657580.1 tetratricopeptide repeat protein [Acidobacteriota bacterium]
MSETTARFVIDVTQANFRADVLQRSRELPVLVDFWAPWCAPCRQLSPILEKLAEEFKGAFILAKVNTEENPYLALDYQVRSIPHGMLFRNEQPIDGFVGVLGEAQARAFLQRHCPTELDRWVALAREKEQAGDDESAQELYRKILSLDSRHPAAFLALGRSALRAGRQDQAKAYLQEISSLTGESDTASRLLDLLPFFEEGLASDESTCREALRATPEALDVRYRHAASLAAHQKYREALEELMTIIAKDKRYRDEIARKTMLLLFSLLGERSAISDEYRQRLARTLY